MKDLKNSSNILSILFVFILFSCEEQKVSTKNQKPNVLIILTDDQGYGDLGYHGNPIIKTPHLNAFAKKALELTNFHVGTTCTPTRAGIMTGRNSNRNNAWHTIAGCSILLEDEETIAEVFKRDGYQTSMFGKWHLGDNYPFRPQDRGFKNAFYHGGGGVNQTPDYWNNNYFDDTYFRNGKPEKTNGYCTDVWFDEAIEYLDKTTKESPFFMYLALNAAHGPFNVPEKYKALYDNASLTDIQKRFYGMITNIDDNFSRLIKHLKKTNQYDNTILIFMTDNGTALGIDKDLKGNQLGYNSNLRGKKGSHYDGGHKVPFFISWPKGDILQEEANDKLIAHVDLLPTLADLAGVSYQPKKMLDGTNVATLLRGDNKSIDRMLVIDTQRNQLPEKGRNSCVMDGHWRLIDGKELYNTDEDPGQNNDIAEAHPEMVTKMQTFYNQWWSSVEPDVRYAEIPIGHDVQNSVLITIHDMHTSENIPWNQKQIRQGENSPEGYYAIKIIEDGNFQFKLYRYPPESGLALNAAAEKIKATTFQDGLPEGKKIKIVKGEVSVGEKRLEATVDANLPFVSIEGRLTEGSYKLKSNFINSDGSIMPSYYLQIYKN